MFLISDGSLNDLMPAIVVDHEDLIDSAIEEFLKETGIDEIFVVVHKIGERVR
jgi:hypothetical protein